MDFGPLSTGEAAEVACKAFHHCDEVGIHVPFDDLDEVGHPVCLFTLPPHAPTLLVVGRLG